MCSDMSLAPRATIFVTSAVAMSTIARALASCNTTKAVLSSPLIPMYSGSKSCETEAPPSVHPSASHEGPKILTPSAINVAF